MIVFVKKLDENAVLPKYGTEGSAAMDLTATSKSYKKDRDTGEIVYVEYGTGLAMDVREGHVGLLFPRSSVSKTNLTLANSVGVIDSDYRGEVKLRFKVKDARFSDLQSYEVGERIGQLMVVPYPKITIHEVDELVDTDRGSGGFGSTGT